MKNRSRFLILAAVWLAACPAPLPVPDTTLGGDRVTVRDYLYEGTAEAPGFGLYSYLLFGSRPSPATVDRYKAALDAFLRLTPAIEQRNIKKADLNITYLPVTGKLPKAPTADDLLKHYDFARAEAMLAQIPGAQVDGPYFFSAFIPLTAGAPAEYLFQDQSSVPPDLVVLWVDQFLKEASKPIPWEPARMDHFVLQLRTCIARGAQEMPKVLDAFKKARELVDLIRWTKK